MSNSQPRHRIGREPAQAIGPPGLLAAAVAAVLPALLAAPLQAQQQVPTDFADELVVGELDRPVAIAFVPDGRLFVIEHVTARLRLVVSGAMAAVDPVLTVPNVASGYGEQGLLGLAVDPRWPSLPHVYLYYTNGVPGLIEITRYTVGGDLAFTGDGALTIDPASRYDVMTNIPDELVIHNGGTIRFGLDGMLYVSIGDDGYHCEAQALTGMRGKILRIDVSRLPDGPGGPPPMELLTPPDNPFVTHPDPVARLVWAYGLRNAWSFHIDPQDGHLFIADVGSSLREEVDWAPGPGLNFGWCLREGTVNTGITCQDVDSTSFVDPIWEFDREDGVTLISVGLYRRVLGVGGFPPEYDGDLFVADYYRGWIKRLKRVGTAWSLAPPVPGQYNTETWSSGYGNVVNGALGPDGALWYCQTTSDFIWDRPSGVVRRIVYSGVIGVAASPSAPPGLEAPRPSPASAPVRLAYRLPARAAVRLAIVDVAGRLVRMLVDESAMGPGRHEVVWDGRDRDGHSVRSGIYFVRLMAAGTRVQRSLARLR